MSLLSVNKAVFKAELLKQTKNNNISRLVLNSAKSRSLLQQNKSRILILYEHKYFFLIEIRSMS